MTPPLAVAIVLALAAALACVRVAWCWHRLRAQLAPWRPIVMLLAQPLLAGLLYLALFPPERVSRADGVLTVLAEGASPRDAASAPGRVVALPEAPALYGVDRVPDLATALRREAGTRAMHVVGFGLPARDRDAAHGLAIEARFPPLPPGLHALEVEQGVVAGARFAVSGTIDGVESARVELQDPAGRRVDAVEVGGDGHFRLHATAFAAGSANFSLQVIGGDGARIETADVPVWIEDAPRLRVLLLAGAPNPETRALRRWMQDAGIEVEARIALGAGMQLGDAPALTPDALARFDLVVADARAWGDLGGGGRATILQAVDAGLGLLVRADTALAGAALQALQGRDAGLAGGRGTAPVRVPSSPLAGEDIIHATLGTGSEDAPVDPMQFEDEVPGLTRRDWRVAGTGAVPMAFAAEDAPVAWWHARGSGRVGIWTLLDTWRLPLSGRTDLYAGLWNVAFSSVARAREGTVAVITGAARVHERLAICMPGEGASVVDPDGRRTALVIDADARGCAAFWPRVAGWHALENVAGGQKFHVLAADVLPGVRAAALRDATRALAARPDRASRGGGDDGAALVQRPTASWPWFFAWLALAAGLWWFERSRHGRLQDGHVAR